MDFIDPDDTFSSLQFSCTPSSAGIKTGFVDYGEGTYNFTVNVSEGGSTLPESFTCTSGSQTQTWKGLEWQRCDDNNTYLGQEAKDYCDNLVLGGHSDWRLPTKDELKSLVFCTDGTPTPLVDPPDEPHRCGSGYEAPTIDPSFECHSVGRYWSSTPKEVTETGPLASKELTWDVNFSTGAATYENPNTCPFYVRCVR